MRKLKESSGINIDFTSRTVVLIGDDMIDVIFTDALGDREVDESVVTAVALAIVGQHHPDYIDDGVGLPWSLGSMPEDSDYLLTKMPSTFKRVEFKSDGGVHGTV